MFCRKSWKMHKTSSCMVPFHFSLDISILGAKHLDHFSKLTYSTLFTLHFVLYPHEFVKGFRKNLKIPVGWTAVPLFLTSQSVHPLLNNSLSQKKPRWLQCAYWASQSAVRQHFWASRSQNEQFPYPPHSRLECVFVCMHACTNTHTNPGTHRTIKMFSSLVYYARTDNWQRCKRTEVSDEQMWCLKQVPEDVFVKWQIKMLPGPWSDSTSSQLPVPDQKQCSHRMQSAVPT